MGIAVGGECRPGTTAIITRSWQPPQQVRRCGLRAKRRRQLLDLLLGSPRRPIEDLDQVSFVEHVAQLDERREVEAAVGQVVGHERKARQQPRSRGAPESRCLGQTEKFGAERKQRREPLGQDGLPSIQLGEVAEELDEQTSFVLADLDEAADEHVVGKVAEGNHDSLYATFFTPHRAHEAAVGATNRTRVFAPNHE